ncbi:MAG: glucose 1-dehydrogenase [Clostridiales bacterium]|nr:glucose 1-dehydrogenase [Clostridiales bacterium]
MGERLKDKVCIITGATSGIGAAAAELFAEEGGKVVFAGRRQESGQKIEAELRAKGYSVKFVRTDITVSADLENLVAQALETYGRIDVLFNNAGITNYQLLADMDMERLDQIMNSNFRGMAELIKLVVPHMIEQGGPASIVNTASIGAIVGSRTLTGYCASKGAVKQFSKACAHEFGEYGIRVNCLEPGLTLTDMTIHDPEFLEMASAHITLNRGAQPREIAYGALFLACDESSFVTGTELIMDGGFTSCM